MDTLEDFSSEAKPTLEDFASTQPAPNSGLPEKTIKTRSAYAALLLNNPETLLADYQAMVAEAKEGKEAVRKSILDSAAIPDTQADIKVLTSILADKNMDYDQKYTAMETYRRTKQYTPEEAVVTRAAIAENPGESHENEMVRISVAEQFGPVHELLKTKQGIINRHQIMINQDGVAKSVIPDLLEMMIPFATNKLAATRFTEYSKMLGGNPSAAKNFFLSGEAGNDVKEALERMPVGKRLEFMQKLAAAIDNNQGIIFQSDNKVNEWMQMKAFIGGDYSKLDRFLDNASSILDIVGLGFTAKGVKQFLKGKPAATAAGKSLEGQYLSREEIENLFKKTNTRSITDQVAPTSPARLVNEVNPGKALSSYEAAVFSKGDEAAEALFGASKDEVRFSENVPQPSVADGSVASKIVAPEERARDTINEVFRAYDDIGGIQYSERERAAAKAYVVTDLESLAGVKQFDNMTTITEEGGVVKINATFGLPTSGFLKADEALDQVKFALKEYGATEENLQLLKKVDGEYTPVKLEDVKGVDGDYVVQFKTDYRYNKDIVGQLDKTDVKLNWFDKIPTFVWGKTGSLSRLLLDPASMLHPLYTNAASVVNDIGVRIDKILLKEHAKYSDAFVKFSKDRQAKVYDHLKAANQGGFEWTDSQLVADGFRAEEIQAIKNFRAAWDTHYFFENRDVAIGLRNKGYQLFENAGGDRFVAKKVENVSEINAYDPDLQQIIKLTKQEEADLIAKGGYYAAFRAPIKVSGKNIEHIIIRNTQSNYLRRINDNDQILNYRKGYYQVTYNAPKYIEEIVKGSDGEELYRRALEVAGDTAEAEQIKKRLASSTGRPLTDFNIRDDKAMLKSDSDQLWHLNSASGRIAQRHRGKQLEDATARHGGFDSKYVANPVESAIRAARSLSGRIATQEQIDVAKARVMQEHPEFFHKIEGQMRWPDNPNDIKLTKTANSKEAADVRTKIEHINYLQDGYMNSFDEGFKGAMNALASTMDAMKIPMGERVALGMSRLNPTSFAKSAVAQSFLFLNPIRQFLVQANQGLRALAVAPHYMIQLPFDARKVLTYLATKDMSSFSKADQEMIEFVVKSGQLEAVDRSNLVRGVLTEMADFSTGLKKTAANALAFPRKWGFDKGEEVNLIAHLLATRADAISKGMNVADKGVQAELFARARALTYEMNHAGDMPYNQNWSSMFMQFFQVPHKAMLQYSNRKIPGAIKLRLALSDMAMWGVPGGLIISQYIPEEMMPSKPEHRELFMFGTEGWMMNKVFSNIAGKEVNIDFSSLSPYGLDGFAKLFHGLKTQDYSEFVASAPAFSVGSKMGEAIGRLARWGGYMPDGELRKEDIVSVAKGFAEAMSAGFNNAMKGKAIYEFGKIKDAKGDIIMHDATAMHAIAQAFGFKTQEEALSWAHRKQIKEGTKEFNDEVNLAYNNYLKYLAREPEASNEDMEFRNRVMGGMYKMYANNPEALKIIRKNLERDLVERQDSIMRGAFKYARVRSKGDVDKVLNDMAILGDPNLDRARQAVADIENNMNKEQ